MENQILADETKQSNISEFSDSNHFADLCKNLPLALINGDINAAMEMLQSFLGSIPYEIDQDREKYFQNAIHQIVTMLGMNSRPEVRIDAGRIDTLIETKHYVYCFEFILKGTAEEALMQISSKDYMLPWKGSGKKLFKVGVEFNYEKRNIGAWKYVCKCAAR